MFKVIGAIFGVVGLTLWFSSASLLDYFSKNRPPTYDAHAGRIHVLYNHGWVAYLISSEMYLLHGLMVGGIACFLVAATFSLAEERVKRRLWDEKISHLAGAKPTDASARLIVEPAESASLSVATGPSMHWPVVLTTDLSPQLCTTRLRGILGGERVIGRVSERSAFLCKSGYQFDMGQRVAFRNSFRPWLQVKLVGTPSGTSLVCRKGMHPVVLAFLALWFGLLMFFAVYIALGPTATTHRFTALGFIAGVSVAGAATVWGGRMLARGEVGYLLDVVVEATEARLT